MSDAEFQATIHFFLTQRVERGGLLACGCPARPLVDRKFASRVVRPYEAAKVTGARLFVGCRLDLEVGRRRKSR
jgi:hypothetical protein